MMRLIALVLGCLLIGGLILAPIAPRIDDTLPYPANSMVSDLTLTHWSAFEYARQQLAATGHVPLWRTSILSGTPFAENPLAGLFYPPHWLALFAPSPTATPLPLAVALNLLLWLHFSMAAAAMYALLRRWQVRPLAAFASAIAYAAAPKIVAHMGLGHLTLVEAWAWLPLVMYPLPSPPPFASFDSASLRSGCANRGGSTLSGVALGVCVLADARMAIYAGALAISYLIVIGAERGAERGAGRGAKRDRRAWLRTPGRVLIVIVVAATVSAAAWLPTLSLSNNTSRAALSPDEAGVLSLDPVYLLGLLIADRSGAAERTTYVGLSVLVLAVIGALRARSIPARLRAWLTGVIVIGAIVAVGTHTPLYDLLLQLPGASLLRVPARAWFVVVFAFAVLAGVGLQTVLASVRRPAHQTVVAAVSLGLIVIELMSVDWAVYRVETVEAAFSKGRDVAAWLKQQPGDFRVYSPSLSIPQHVAQQYELQLADGVDPLQLTRYVRLMQRATGVGAWGYSVTLPPFAGITTDADIGTALKDVQPNTALLGALNVKFVVAEFPIESADLIERYRSGETIVYENDRYRPRAVVVNRIDVATSPDEAATWLESTALDAAAVVEGLPYPIELPTTARDVRIIDWQADRIQIEAAGPGLLVLSEVYAPDWTATLAGEPAMIFATDVALRGVYVPWGTHSIELVYQPKRVYAGLMISLLGLMACGVALALATFTERQRRAVESLKI
ncbi:MAG: hypothetical protein HY870_15135 [Chloroflexi bacterium]|nr:hypothetical protein [Chloroflexota bacterium]